MAGFHDIRGPVAITTLPPFALTGGVLLLIGGLLLLRRRRPTEPKPAPTKLPPPDFRTLLAQLAAEYRQGGCSNDQTMQRLDTLLRDALEAAGIPAHARTSAELRAHGASRLDAGLLSCVDELLALGDQAKFAGRQPDAGAIEAALRDAETLFAHLEQGPAI